MPDGNAIADTMRQLEARLSGDEIEHYSAPRGLKCAVEGPVATGSRER
jgi:hypothetical protein